ncbi:MAG: glycosyltransferase [Bacteroidetes bacterium]|nr:glycosyltransferase [Bacteroidota bacterium]
MKVLIVCSGTEGILSPFIKDQMDSLTKFGIEFSLFQINKKGFLGYLIHLFSLRKVIKKNNPDLIHAHYGLSGLLANLQLIVPVVTTFHGSDINDKHVFIYSKFANRLSAASIFVEISMYNKIAKLNNAEVIPCGVDLATFYSISKPEAISKMGLDKKDVNILFSSSFNNFIKNYDLARESCKNLEKMLGKKVNLIELKNYNRDETNLLFNAVDCSLLTSFSEGSPQFIKEAMACGCPLVSTDVGDVKMVIGNTKGCYLTSFNTNEVAKEIKNALDFNQKTKGRNQIIELGLDTETIAKKIISVFNKVLKK